MELTHIYIYIYAVLSSSVETELVVEQIVNK